MASWTEFDIDFIRRRYNRLAPIYPIFEWVLWLPWGIRQRAVQELELKPGDRVLEVGCGTGRNFPHLLQIIGPTGHLYGVDVTEGMLRVARSRCAKRGWKNVSLLQQDATRLTLPEPVDAVLFSLSYAVISDQQQALRQAWFYLRPGRHLVVMDAKRPPGILGKTLGAIGTWVSRATVLGDPDKRPWYDLCELTNRIELSQELFGMYYICRGTKESADAHTAKG